MSMFSREIDCFEHEAVCVELAALRTAIVEMPDSGEVLARADELKNLVHKGEWIRQGAKVLPKAEYYKQFKNAPEG